MIRNRMTAKHSHRVWVTKNRFWKAQSCHGSCYEHWEWQRANYISINISSISHKICTRFCCALCCYGYITISQWTHDVWYMWYMYQNHLGLFIYLFLLFYFLFYFIFLGGGWGWGWQWYNHVFVQHCNDVTMSAIASLITSLPIVFSTVYSDADRRKHQSSALRPLWGEFTGDQWIPHTKSQ